MSVQTFIEQWHKTTFAMLALLGLVWAAVTVVNEIVSNAQHYPALNEKLEETGKKVERIPVLENSVEQLKNKVEALTQLVDQIKTSQDKAAYLERATKEQAIDDRVEIIQRLDKISEIIGDSKAPPAKINRSGPR